MRRLIIFCTLFIFIANSAYSQISTPEKKTFNIGLFTGIGGINFSPIPGIDLAYKKTALRVAPGYRAIGGGFIREILPFSPVYYNCLWIASIYGGVEYKEDVRAPKVQSDHLTTQYTKAMLMTGAKIYFIKRCYSQFQLGLIYTKEETTGYSTINSLNPYFEFSFGINLFKTYINEKEEE